MITFNGSIMKVGSSWLGISSTPDPYNPLGLPPYTIRLQYPDWVTPTFSNGTGTQVSASPNVWDLTYNSAFWDYLLSGHDSLMSVLGANATGVTSVRFMFKDCSYLSTVALFDTSSVTIMVAMFAGCDSLTTVPLFDTSSVASSVDSVKGMNSMFYGCGSLRSVPLFDTSSVTDMGGMFWGCGSLTTIPLFDTSSVTFMSGMFRGCTSLTTVPLLNTSSATIMINMFRDCSSLTTVPLLNTSSAEDMGNMFRDCIAVQSGARALYTQASTQTIPPMYHDNCFTNCGVNTVTGRAELDQIPADWK